MTKKKEKELTENLTEKQERFCLAIINGKNQSDAYRSVFASKGGTPNSTWRAASELRNNPKVAARIREMRQELLTATGVTLSGHLTQLADLRDIAVKDGKIASAINAEIARGKTAGFYDKVNADATLNNDDLPKSLIIQGF